jgi:GcrA cell cycle regulator
VTHSVIQDPGQRLSIVGLSLISIDTPSFGTPIFSTEDSNFNYIQFSQSQILIDGFISLPERTTSARQFKHARLNHPFQVRDPFMYGFSDINNFTAAYDRETLEAKLRSEFSEYKKYPFLLFAVAKFINDTQYLDQATCLPEVSQAIKNGELLDPRPNLEATQVLTGDDKTQLLKKMWQDGLSASEIGKALGLSRNSIIGKIHKLGLGSRPPRSPALETEAFGIEERKERSIPLDHRVSILELTEKTCRWPMGDPSSAEFFFCGRPVVEGTPYCADHVQIANRPSPSDFYHKPPPWTESD